MCNVDSTVHEYQLCCFRFTREDTQAVTIERLVLRYSRLREINASLQSTPRHYRYSTADSAGLVQFYSTLCNIGRDQELAKPVLNSVDRAVLGKASWPQLRSVSRYLA